MDKIGILFPGLFVVFMVVERLFPARRFPAVPWWRLKCIALFALGGVINTQLPKLWAEWAPSHRLLNLDALGVAGGAVVALVGTDFFMYWKHRIEHRVPFLWRWMHQMHHSVERLDASASFFGHPLDIVTNAVVISLVGVFVLGVRPEAAAIAGVVGFAVSVFEHTNIRTPRWLGYIIQRPESHGVHHERGVHAFNYGALALWDAVFGTLRNPVTWQGQTGFWDGASRRMGALLVGVDVSTPPAAEPRRASAAA